MRERIAFTMRRVIGLVLVLIAGVAGVRDAAAQTAAPMSVVCGSAAGARQTCQANTSGAVTLVKTLGTVACDLGRTWGYDAAGIWVADGCRAEFAVAPAAREKFGRYTPTGGFTLADTEYGDVNLRIFSYVRYLNGLGTDATFTDAFGDTRPVQRRNDPEMNKAQISKSNRPGTECSPRMPG